MQYNFTNANGTLSIDSSDLIKIAELCHAVNKAYCQSIGDYSQPEWKDAPEWQQNSAFTGVVAHFTNNLSPQESHQVWLDQKVREGWVYGEVKDPEAKTHPCIVSYAELPVEQRTKDYLFKAICDFYKS